MRLVISSGHGKHIRGASGILDEVDEARQVVDRVADLLRNLDVDVLTFHDDVSTSQNENLERIVSYHNAQTRDLDISVHFNAYEPTAKPMGTEVLYATQEDLAADLSLEMASAMGLPNRGAKHRSDLYFLNETEMPALLIETCFVDSSADAAAYDFHFDTLCRTIAETLSGGADIDVPPERPPIEPLPEPVVFAGRCSHFGGPADQGVSPDEGLAFIYDVSDAPHLFLPEQPPGTTGLARRLDPDIFYVACRWDYDTTPKEMLDDPMLKARVTCNETGKWFLAWPADWGPHGDTERVADLSPGLMHALGIETDDEVIVLYPAPRRS
jgi:N-acetylmuramoyl-L-alanine amidase